MDKQKNPDLTRLVLKYTDKFDSITYTWVKGHAGIVLNELVDEDCQHALNSPHKWEDKGYTGHSDTGLIKAAIF